MADQVTLLIATKKGAFMLSSDRSRQDWRLQGPIMLGNIVHHFVADARDGTMLIAAKTGHLGPTIFRSRDRGESWQEAQRPPAFERAAEGGRTVDHVFWLTPGHPDEPSVWYAGTSPQGLFRSEDGGDSWEPVAGFNNHPQYRAWTGGEQDGTPDGPKLHSILVDPRDPRHLYIGMSSGGVFESTDRGENWHPLNQGCRADFLPDPYPEFGQDPHCVRLHPREPDLLYQQNHCGIYRLDRRNDRSESAWERIGANMPAEVGDIGFPLVLHPRDPQTLWVCPMDGTAVWPRTSIDGKPAIYRTRDAGQSWTRLDRGLPPANAWFTVFRQAMTADSEDPVGVYFGTTCGEIWGSADEGESWKTISRHLPHVYALEAAIL